MLLAAIDAPKRHQLLVCQEFLGHVLLEGNREKKDANEKRVLIYASASLLQQSVASTMLKTAPRKITSHKALE